MSDDPDEIRRLYEEAEEADLLNARRAPSHYANRAFIRTYGGLTRITLGERVMYGEPTIWNSAFTLPTAEAVAIAKLIIAQAEYDAEHRAHFQEIMGDWQDKPEADETGDA